MHTIIILAGVAVAAGLILRKIKMLDAATQAMLDEVAAKIAATTSAEEGAVVLIEHMSGQIKDLSEKIATGNAGGAPEVLAALNSMSNQLEAGKDDLSKAIADAGDFGGGDASSGEGSTAGGDTAGGADTFTGGATDGSGAGGDTLTGSAGDDALTGGATEV